MGYGLRLQGKLEKYLVLERDNVVNAEGYHGLELGLLQKKGSMDDELIRRWCI